jgi:site-specific DNA-methyltransferase (adenine-specific)
MRKMAESVPATTPDGVSVGAKPVFSTPMGAMFRGDATSVLVKLPPHSVDCVVGSPPYFAVRDYGVKGQIGVENTIDAYIARMCDAYDAAKHVLKRSGSCWVVIGDLYQEKDLVLLPGRFALEMKRRGWILRNDVIWRKTRCLPHPVKDRLINTHEHIFHFVVSENYYYDLDSIRLPHAASSINRVKSKIKVSHKGRYGKDAGNRGRTIDFLDETSAVHPKGRNPGDVFDACPSNAADGHLATYPEELIEPRIVSTCPPRGTVLDFWMGSGTTALVAEKLGRHWIGVELNPDYCAIAKRRLSKPRQALLQPQDM